ncbi:MAG: hypothetical protein EOM26_04515 [Alphaproteobacteria bacterium]|nr:hypothetical protein [Alphaproteobacteria bacterium]
MWCQEGLTVYLEALVWPPGRYEFMIEADNEVIFCEGRMPFPSCDGNTSCDRAGVLIGEHGCALEKDLHAFGTIMMEQVPQKIAVHIKQDKGWFSSDSVNVNPQCGYPNGEECDPRPCCSASVSMPVEWKFRKEVAQ